jgi:hypothetical protein
MTTTSTIFCDLCGDEAEAFELRFCREHFEAYLDAKRYRRDERGFTSYTRQDFVSSHDEDTCNVCAEVRAERILHG